MATYFYDVVFALEGIIDPAETPPSTAIPVWTAPRQTIFGADFGGSVGSVGTNPTAPASFTVRKNGSGAGTCDVAVDGTVTFTSLAGAPVTFNAGDRLTIETPAMSDATLADPSFVLVGTVTI